MRSRELKVGMVVVVTRVLPGDGFRGDWVKKPYAEYMERYFKAPITITEITHSKSRTAVEGISHMSQTHFYIKANFRLATKEEIESARIHL